MINLIILGAFTDPFPDSHPLVLGQGPLTVWIMYRRFIFEYLHEPAVVGPSRPDQAAVRGIYKSVVIIEWIGIGAANDAVAARVSAVICDDGLHMVHIAYIFGRENDVGNVIVAAGAGVQPKQCY